MSRASDKSLDALHGLLAETLASELRAAKERAKDKWVDGEFVPGTPIPPQLFDKILKFLKDNGIDAPARANAGLSSLADELADLDLDEEAQGRLQ